MFTPEQEAHLVKRFGQALRAFRKNRQLTQEQFAEHIGCSTRQLQDIEIGETTTSFLFFLAMLASMKDEQLLEFLQRFIPEVREVLKVQPLRRSDSGVFSRTDTASAKSPSLWQRVWN